MRVRKNCLGLVLVLPVLLTCWQCHQRSLPLSPHDAAAVSLRLSFHGRELSRPADLRKASQPATIQQISQLVVCVFATEEDTVALDTIAIVLDPDQRTFRADLTAPTGTGRVVEVDAFEEFFDEFENSFFALTWRGRTTGIDVLRNDTVRVAIELFPVPILGQRVVVDVSAGSGTRGSTGNPVEIALANLDQIRGLQFDLLYTNNLVEPEQFNRLGRITDFNGIRAVTVPGQIQGRSIYRVVIFDQNNPPGEITPVGRTLEPETIAQILFKVATGTGAATDTLKLVSGVATTADLQNLEVFVKDDGIFVVR